MKANTYLTAFLTNIFLLCFANLALSQTRTVTGKVTLADGETTLPGVTVVVKNTGDGAVTDFDGTYSIEVKTPDAVLAFSFVGYATQVSDRCGRSSVGASAFQC